MRLLAVFVLVGAGLLRLPGLRTELSMDEIWSVQNVSAASAWWDLFLRFKIDNNHHLTSLYMYGLGSSASPTAYRLLALVSGIATVPLAWRIGARESRISALTTTLLLGTSAVLVFYASEARGYSTVVCLTLAAWYALQRYAETPSARWTIIFAVCSVLGVLAHQTFVMFYVGAFVWCDAHLQRTHRLREATRLTRRLFAVPTVLIALFAVVALRGQEIGGGPPFHVLTVVAQTLSAVSGGPQGGVGLWVAASMVGSVCAIAVCSAYRAGDDRWILFVTAGVVAPLLIVLARQPTTLAPRYFLVPAAVLLLAVSSWLARLIPSGTAQRRIAMALVTLHVVGGVWFTFSEASSRGHSRAAIEHMLAASPDVVTVTSSDRYGGSDYRTQMVVDYYGRVLSGNRQVRYISPGDYRPGRADWVIVETLGQSAEAEISDPFGQRFGLAGVYPAGALSGTSWYLYRRRLRSGAASSLLPAQISSKTQSKPRARSLTGRSCSSSECPAFLFDDDRHACVDCDLRASPSGGPARTHSPGQSRMELLSASELKCWTERRRAILKGE